MAELDTHVQKLCANSAYDEATELILRQLGPAVFRYLSARTRDEQLATEAFSAFAEDLWLGLASYQGRSEVRVWAFTVARNALGQLFRHGNRERKRSRAWSSTLSNRIAEQVRTETVEYLKTEVKQRFAELREQLGAEEQDLLALRVNQQLSWDEIARIQNQELSDAEVKREAARLRKRFQLTRAKLRELAREAGLLREGD